MSHFTENWPSTKAETKGWQACDFLAPLLIAFGVQPFLFSIFFFSGSPDSLICSMAGFLGRRVSHQAGPLRVGFGFRVWGLGFRGKGLAGSVVYNTTISGQGVGVIPSYSRNSEGVGRVRVLRFVVEGCRVNPRPQPLNSKPRTQASKP